MEAANEPNMASGNNGIIPRIVVSDAIITGRRRLCELSISAVTGSTPCLSAINAENQQIVKQAPNFTPKSVKLGAFVLFKIYT